MFVGAALVPDTALLVPGAGGTADAGAVLRDAALAAAGEAAASGGRIVVVAPGRSDRRLRAGVRASLGAAGIPDEALAWRMPAQVPDPPGEGGPGPVAGVSASVALVLLARHGAVAADVVEIAAQDAPPGRPAASSEVAAQDDVPGRAVASHEAAAQDDGRADALRELGARLVAETPTALVVVGSPSARHGPDAPLPDDPRAPAYDDAVLTDLADAGLEARRRLRALDPTLAAALAVTGWAPWQVLLGAVGDLDVEARLLRRHVLAGATHAVLTWRALAPEGLRR